MSGDDGSHMENLELPSEKGQTSTDEFNWASIPDEIDSFKEAVFENEAECKTIDLRRMSENSQNVSVKHSNTIDLSKKWDSIEMNSIFASESQSNQSTSKENDQNIFKLWKDMNNAAVELIRQGVRLQELEEENSSEGEIDEEENLRKAFIWYSKAHTWLESWMKSIEANERLFSVANLITIYFNVAWIFQKKSQLKETSIYLDKCLQLLWKIRSTSQAVELNKSRHITKIELQQWAVISQIDSHEEALEHGKLSVKSCQTLIYRTYKMCK